MLDSASGEGAKQEINVVRLMRLLGTQGVGFAVHYALCRRLVWGKIFPDNQPDHISSKQQKLDVPCGFPCDDHSTYIELIITLTFLDDSVHILFLNPGLTYSH